jgi:WS/DGAT/MGAT family acyltransferase
MLERISANDAIWLQDSDTNLMVINAVIITDRLTVATLRRTFQKRVFGGPDPARFQRLRCRIINRGGVSYWEEDPTFDIARHIVPAQGKKLNSLKEVQAYVGRMANRKLDLRHPGWEIKVIERFEDGASAILVRIHHCIGDGMALVSLMFALMDETWDRPDGLAKGSLPPAGGLNPFQLLQRAVAVSLSAPSVLLRRLAWFPDSSHLHGPILSGRKRVAWTEPLDLQVVKQVKDLIGATVNDVLMATVSGAFSSYLARKGVAAPARFLVSMPVNVRHPGTPLRCENKFAAVPLELPASTDPTSHRILAVKERLDQLKQSTTPLVVYGLQQALLAFLPEVVSRGLIDFLANKCTAVVTNVAGPTHDVSLEGRKVRSILFWVPQRAQIGIGISILSFAGKVQIGVIADKALLPDPAHLVAAFEAEFDDLKRLCN